MAQAVRVVVAMSGGVDSSVAAALLKEKGYDVIGVTMQIWPRLAPEEEVRRGGCCSLAAVEDARKVADRIGIPYYVMNFGGVFKERVIDYFIEEYARGKTPNPCIACNFYVKWGALLRKALGLGAKYVATGHYARIDYDPSLGRYLLYRGLDPEKDQSYALYGLTQDQLAHTLFPLGPYTKKEVRARAGKLGLVVAEKPESQEICFVTGDDYHSFLREFIPDKIEPGPILNTSGEVVGRHRGIPFYTIGQRRGLGLSMGEPVYVVDIKADENVIVVGTKEEVYSRGLYAAEVNFIPFERLNGEKRVQAQIRYRAPAVPARIVPAGGENGEELVKVLFDEPQRAVTPGQSVVFYEGDLVLGGGIIRERL